MNTRVLLAVFKRNFIGYFANPTGYVFICVFVLLSSIAAFLPYEFFSANLANLDQLNQWFPLIMLVFIPAITMGIWAEERRQGTDELLLTIPAGDFEIVFGKYLSAVAIYTVSLLFSLVCNYSVLSYLGNPDPGLFYCTYLGYWFTGIAMLAIGMVASFLTGNLTVAYILGAIFCVPPVAMFWSDVAPLPGEFALFLKRFSIGEQFNLFGRGIVSLGGVVYFIAVVAVMLYLCMVLIGKRHWSASQKFVGAFHYTIRTLSLLLIGFSLTMILDRAAIRADMTEEKLSTLSPLTLDLVKNVDAEHPVMIDAYLSPEVPEPYIQTRMNIISVLNEFQARSKGNISVRFHEVKPYTEAAMIASERYNIKPREVWFVAQGNRNKSNIYLGVSFRCGLQSQTLPFIDRGLSPEYELVHALCSVTAPQKKRIGILKTDVPLIGQFSMETFSKTQDMRIVEELRKRYTVVEVNPSAPITEKYDALLAVQPSSLAPAEMENFVSAIREGQPTVIFEDPFPIWYGGVTGTDEPRQPRNQMMMMQGQVPPKGDVSRLWRLLGVHLDGGNNVWQDYNPIRKFSSFPKGMVFLDKVEDDATGKTVSPFTEESLITQNLQYMLLPFPGSITKMPDSKLTYEPLLRTIRRPSGINSVANTKAAMNEYNRGMIGGGIEEIFDRSNVTTEGPKTLAARISGEITVPVPPPTNPADTEFKAPEPKKVNLNVILIADIDMMQNDLFAYQEQGSPPGMGVNLDFENVPFILNAIDSVAGDERFLAIRTRRPTHRTLQRIDKATDAMREKASEQQQAYRNDLKKQIEEETEKMHERLDKIRTEMQSGNVTSQDVIARVQAIAGMSQKNLETRQKTLEREVEQKVEKETMLLNEYVALVQGRYKFYAVVLPPIPPLLIGGFVFLGRRIREYEGVPKSRRKK